MKELIRKSEARAAVLKANPATAYCIDSIKAVDAREVVHGTWVARAIDLENYEGYDMFDCSICGRNGNPWYAFCPHCGATMNGKSNVLR